VDDRLWAGRSHRVHQGGAIIDVTHDYLCTSVSHLLRLPL
jgi:hypothetical protein